tara:strand:- start:31 stop:1254 length:1224 start_codon:yes stop_codon:yes gene_type:complete
MNYKKLVDRYRNTGKIIWEDMKNIDTNHIKDYDCLNEDISSINKIMNKIAIIKLNGGLGTSMGCNKAKSLINIRKDTNFIDCIIEQIDNVNNKYNISIPLIFMNSVHTDKDTKDYIKSKNFNVDVHFFNQEFYPRLNPENLEPITSDSTIKDISEWYPPGHGNIYSSLHNDPLFNKLKEKGIEYLFISNADNLAATFDENIYNFIYNKYDFCLELTEKTLNDVKGGTVVLYEDKLKLLEVAQVPKQHLNDFYSIDKFKFFNTNNLWIKLDKIHNNMNLDVIYNKKNIHGKDIVQLETAMASVISNFNKSVCINVPRRRFFPIKRCCDIFLLMSNIINIEKGFIRCMREKLPLIDLDDNYKNYNEFIQKFPSGMPDIKELNALKIRGNIIFDGNMCLRGNVEIKNIEI